jgi:hypothetical protein
MRILAPSFLHHQNLSGWATYGMDDKLIFVNFDARKGCIFSKCLIFQAHALTDFKMYAEYALQIFMLMFLSQAQHAIKICTNSRISGPNNKKNFIS